jgi:hypothetical protein
MPQVDFVGQNVTVSWWRSRGVGGAVFTFATWADPQEIWSDRSKGPDPQDSIQAELRALEDESRMDGTCDDSPMSLMAATTSLGSTSDVRALSGFSACLSVGGGTLVRDAWARPEVYDAHGWLFDGGINLSPEVACSLVYRATRNLPIASAPLGVVELGVFKGAIVRRATRFPDLLEGVALANATQRISAWEIHGALNVSDPLIWPGATEVGAAGGAPCSLTFGAGSLSGRSWTIPFVGTCHNIPETIRIELTSEPWGKATWSAGGERDVILRIMHIDTTPLLRCETLKRVHSYPPYLRLPLFRRRILPTVSPMESFAFAAATAAAATVFIARASFSKRHRRFPLAAFLISSVSSCPDYLSEACVACSGTLSPSSCRCSCGWNSFETMMYISIIIPAIILILVRRKMTLSALSAPHAHHSSDQCRCMFKTVLQSTECSTHTLSSAGTCFTALNDFSRAF